MIRPDTEKWGQSLADLRRLSIEAEHPRTRERFLALYQIGSEKTDATQWAIEIGRDENTVSGWVHTYNLLGPEALYYKEKMDDRWCTVSITILTVYYLAFMLFSAWLLFDIWSGNHTVLRDWIKMDPETLEKHAAVFSTLGLTIVGGFFGGILYGIRTMIYYYVKGFDLRWLPKYFTIPFEGAGLALVVLALLRGGVSALGASVTLETDNAAINGFAALGIGSLVGFSTRDVIGWIQAITKTMFNPQTMVNRPDSSNNSDG